MLIAALRKEAVVNTTKTLVPDTLVQKAILYLFAVTTLSLAPFFASAAASEIADAAAAAIANPDRPADHRERDARSKPEVVLPLLALEPGDTAADIMGGGGYYSELMAGIVGKQGTVILHNNTPYAKFVEKQLNERYGEQSRPPITLLKSEVDDLQLGSETLDAALMVMSYHDLYYRAPDRGWGDTDVGLFFEQVRTALKPGGRLVIVDHAAAEGTGNSAAQTIHRIEEAYAREDAVGAGFRFIESNSALRNPADDRTKMVFDKEIRGKTDRFILVFEKP